MKAPLRPIRRWTLRIVILFLALAAIGIFGLRWHFRQSLPILDGELVLPGLSAPARIERDANGVPTIHAANRLDASRTLGFLHAQDRFFGMDTSRRAGAGEVSALVGKVALPFDESKRFFPGRRVAIEAFAKMSEKDRTLLTVYTEGVNAGLAALSAAPPEYVLPGAQTKPWKPEDCLLVILSMYYALQDELGLIDEKRQLIKESFPPEVVAYLFERTPQTFAPLEAAPRQSRPFPVDTWARAIENAPPAPGNAAAPRKAPAIGSNAWAVGASASHHQQAILANDMHLQLRVPNVWYRVSVRYSAADGTPVAVDGPTLPGLPITVIGSNHHVAWGFTNSYTDQTDLVSITLHPDNPDLYQTATDWEPFATRRETIEVANGEPVEVEIKETIWGPVREGLDGRLYAVIWTPMQEGAWNMTFDDMSQARSTKEAIAVAQTSALPTVNIVLADRQGRAAWTLAGKLPNRAATNGFYPLGTRAARPQKPWQGFHNPSTYPKIVDKKDELVWSANQKMVAGKPAAILGDGGYDRSYRAIRIRDTLRAGPMSEADMLALQGDAYALHLKPWHELVMGALDSEALQSNPARRSQRELLVSWDGAANADSVAHSMLTLASEKIFEEVRYHLARPLGERQDSLPTHLRSSFDEIALECLRAPYDTLAPEGYESMRDLILDKLDLVRDLPEANQPWGQTNENHIKHPLFGSLPIIGPWFNMAPNHQSGDEWTIKVVGKSHGSSQRMVVSPGNEADGLYHQPAGPSGHFLSPYFRSGHEDWVHLRPTPFLPGPAKHELVLKPSQAR